MYKALTSPTKHNSQEGDPLETEKKTPLQKKKTVTKLAQPRGLPAFYWPTGTVGCLL
jgi:hypothetical protein